ncbi:MAG: carotenoid biosynthesis protein [Fibrobacteres bacterium]|nr:carotenoid biosynthesis protein [Fibrobacterota bacterium]
MEARTLSHPLEKVAIVGLGLWTVLALLGHAFFPPGSEAPVSLPIALDVFRTGFAQSQILLSALVLIILVRESPRGSAMGLVAVFLASWVIEAVGVQTGIPFGAYAYAEGLGLHLPGEVPWSVPLSWAAATLGVHLFLRRFAPDAGWIRRVFAGSMLLLAWDLVLDPAMSSVLPFWIWGTDGFWYGVPASNLLGWYVSGAVFLGMLEVFASRFERIPSAGILGGYLLLLCATPSAMVAMAGYWFAIAVSLLVAAAGLILVRQKTSRSVGDRVPAAPEDRMDFMARHSRSFRFASRFLSPRLREVVGGVYCWCRVTDDLVDEAEGLSASDVEHRLGVWEELSRRAYEGNHTGIALLDDVFGRMAAEGIPFEIASDLIAGMRMDLAPSPFESPRELRLYSYRVASTVGLWVTRSSGVSDPCVLECAEALGHAMQLTNILRDVGEDLSRGRVYIPLSDLREAGLELSDLKDYAEGARAIDDRWRGLMETLMARADADYRLSLVGMAYLPGSLQTGVAVAAAVYQGIHGAIRRNGYDNFRRRAVTGGLEKIGLGARGWWAMRRVAARVAPVPSLAGGVP